MDIDNKFDYISNRVNESYFLNNGMPWEHVYIREKIFQKMYGT